MLPNTGKDAGWHPRLTQGYEAGEASGLRAACILMASAFTG